MSIIQDFMRDTYKMRIPGFLMAQRPKIICNDGFEMSVQAGRFLYCKPRMDLPDGKYDSVEIGFPSEEEQLIIDFADDCSNLTDTIYPYVPVEIVDKVIEKHGGIKCYE